MIRRLALALSLAATPIWAETVANAPQGELRVLDKITGQVTDLTLAAGETREVGHLLIRLSECRYPVENPSGNAYGELTITYRDQLSPAFQGWMIASAPALNAMDHPRYDVWILRCITS
ncbi:DUF2155 domain-containing protein [Loktanella sp. IMCC34160]|uniref:DUF2155 domain-containing protein n=1 Tax=Loktanella sp. IMCC34160 TaxID=2510646 RepID=UPI00101DDCFE|nr:DUF2155 domain-containing protein [Loktanella sp. IMCC34160]RYG93308.1 DUF2155 domain-containing protein [Loktanella sp. IMCC34160]